MIESKTDVHDLDSMPVVGHEHGGSRWVRAGGLSHGIAFFFDDVAEVERFAARLVEAAREVSS